VTADPSHRQDTGATVYDVLLERVVGLDRALEAVHAAMGLWFASVTIWTATRRAPHISASLAANDFADLTDHLVMGQGRSAIRGVRNLFEHLVNILDSIELPALEQRFLDHRAVTEQVAAGLTFELGRLEGVENKREATRLRNLKNDSRSPISDALAEYGFRFKRDWTNQTLSDRATHHGLADDYELYRLTSAVLHGSSGGAIGTVFQVSQPDGPAVHRLGPALQLCPLAYLQGVSYFRKIVRAIRSIDNRNELSVRSEPILDALDRMDGLWTDYRRVILKLDAELLANAVPIPPLQTVLAVERDGRYSWWIWDLNTKRVARARYPSMTSQVRTAIELCQERVVNLTDTYWQRRSRMTVVLDEVVVSPSSLGSWCPSGELVFKDKPEATYNSTSGFIHVGRPDFGPIAPPSSLVGDNWYPR